jgi:hypothetical protein
MRCRADQRVQDSISSLSSVLVDARPCRRGANLAAWGLEGGTALGPGSTRQGNQLGPGARVGRHQRFSDCVFSRGLIGQPPGLHSLGPPWPPSTTHRHRLSETDCSVHPCMSICTLYTTANAGDTDRQPESVPTLNLQFLGLGSLLSQAGNLATAHRVSIKPHATSRGQSMMDLIRHVFVLYQGCNRVSEHPIELWLTRIVTTTAEETVELAEVSSFAMCSCSWFSFFFSFFLQT